MSKEEIQAKISFKKAVPKRNERKGTSIAFLKQKNKEKLKSTKNLLKLKSASKKEVQAKMSSKKAVPKRNKRKGTSVAFLKQKTKSQQKTKDPPTPSRNPRKSNPRKPSLRKKIDNRCVQNNQIA